MVTQNDSRLGPNSLLKTTSMLKTIQCIKKDIKSIHLLKIEVCKNILTLADEAYYGDSERKEPLLTDRERKEPLLTDSEYEYIKDHVLSIDPGFESELGHTTVQVNKGSVKLPVWMGSMNKKHIIPKEQTNVVLTDKLDGVSCLFSNDPKDGVKLYTRGNGEYGQDITHLYPFICGMKTRSTERFMIRGELIMKKSVFETLKDIESNARNTVSGVVNSKIPNKKYKQKIDFVGYEVVSPSLIPTKQMEYMKSLGIHSVHHIFEERISPAEIHEMLVVRKNDSEYEIDGIILTTNEPYKAIKSGNPKHAFAYKHNFEDNAVVTTVLNVTWNISKNAYYKPTVEFEKICIHDVNIQRATGFNGKFIFENKIGKGSVIKVQRSGDVIPYITEVIRSTTPEMPSDEYIWSPSGNDVMVKSKLNNTELDEKLFEHMLTTLKFGGLGVGSIRKLYHHNVRTLSQLYALDVDAILKIEGFKKTSASKLYANIQNRKNEITCIEYMVASKCFDEGIGKKILIKITTVHQDKRVSLDQLIQIDGVGEARAQSYLEGLARFELFRKKNDLRCVFEAVEVVEGETMKGTFVVFTGFRDAVLVERIEALSGVVQSTLNKKTTHLVYKSKEKSSSKINTAKEMNARAIQLEDFKKEFGF